jgi:hypothetical protein
MITIAAIAVFVIACVFVFAPPVSAASGTETQTVSFQHIVQNEAYLNLEQIEAQEITGRGISMGFLSDTMRAQFFPEDVYLGVTYNPSESHRLKDRVAYKHFVCNIPEFAPYCQASYEELQIPAVPVQLSVEVPVVQYAPLLG